MARKVTYAICILVALTVYAAFALDYNFIQDDAFISYRYVANHVNDGELVYNSGERVEGFTNFGWVIYLITWASLGSDFILVSQVTGFLFGAGVVLLTFLIAREVFDDRYWLFSVAALALVGVNRSLAYWAPAGLETALFAFLALLCLFTYLKRSWGLIVAIVLAVWIRPEGALVAGLLLLIEYAERRKLPRFTMSASAVALLLSLPFIVFKTVYYGSLLPNPFYAKTGFDWQQVTSGLEYCWRFLSHYGFWGVSLIVPAIFFRRLNRNQRAVLLFAALYTLYIVVIGGDVLKVHRFFLPVIGCYAILPLLGLSHLINKVAAKTRTLLLFLISIPLVVLTYEMPREFAEIYNRNEINFTAEQKELAFKMLQFDSTDFSVATSTIGVFGYELLGHKVIDMLGLTDPTIARHSEIAPPDIRHTWKELKHNSQYLLSEAPDYIIFSTGIKPSAPAEQVLLQYPQFLRSYRSVGWHLPPGKTRPRGVMLTAFKRMLTVEGTIYPEYPAAFVRHYKSGLELASTRLFDAAIAEFDRAIQKSPAPVYSYVLYNKALCFLRKRNLTDGRALLDALVEQDSLVYEAHRDLFGLAMMDGDTTKAAIHLGWLMKLVPWHVEEIKRMVDRSMTGSEG